VSGATQPDLRGHTPEQALRALGVRCAVEARGNLAVVIPAVGERALEDAGTRGAILTTLRGYGFTHVAVDPAEDEPARTRDTRIV
jgi:hypothetical protein